MNEETSVSDGGPGVPPTTRQVFLGLFVMAQLFFLLSSNFLGFLKTIRPDLDDEEKKVVEQLAPGWTREKGQAWRFMDAIVQADRMWSHATGQDQHWSLFAPDVAHHNTFMALETRFDDPAREGVWLYSDNEPVDPQSYFRIGLFRIRKFEANLVVTLRPHEGEKPADTAQRWNRVAKDYLDEYRDMLAAYVRWRLKQGVERIGPDASPREVVVWLRRYDITPPAKAPPYWSGPHAVRLARWRPEAPGLFERYDHVAQDFKEPGK